MDEKRDKHANEEGDDVEGHKFAPDDDKFEKREESSDDQDDEVEAHKF